MIIRIKKEATANLDEQFSVIMYTNDDGILLAVTATLEYASDYASRFRQAVKFNYCENIKIEYPADAWEQGKTVSSPYTSSPGSGAEKSRFASVGTPSSAFPLDSSFDYSGIGNVVAYCPSPVRPVVAIADISTIAHTVAERATLSDYVDFVEKLDILVDDLADDIKLRKEEERAKSVGEVKKKPLLTEDETADLRVCKHFDWQFCSESCVTKVREVVERLAGDELR